MSLLTEQLSSAAQNQLAKQITVFQAWSQLAFGGLEKLIALNFNTAKQSLENANNVAHELFAVKQAQELLDLSRAHGQPQLEKILSYGRELASISSDTRAELWQIVSKQSAAVAAATVATTTAATPAPSPKATPAPAAKPAVKKLAAKPIAATKQLTLLAEPEVKPTKAPAKPKAVAKVAEKPVSKVAAKPVTKAVAAKAEVKAVEIKPETIKPAAAKSSKPAKTEATKKPLKTSATTADVAPVAPAAHAAPAAPVPVITPAAPLPAATTTMIEKTLEKKTTPAKKPATKTVTPDNAAPIKADSKPSASTEKKSAVKFPFAATANLKKGPGFPANNGKPSYKAKSSAATGAKKPVRQ
ncbi:MAG: phasin family protein [Burkholderiales bacterium]|nr:phasin family protein [Burkholderiales bacterium]MBI3726949.1 phasin family protein [Burkholderiales bacterium]